MFLWKAIIENSGSTSLSAGRVQSVALRLIVERERERSNFEPIKFYAFIASLSSKNQPFKAFLLKVNEEDFEEGSTDIPVAIMPRLSEVTLLQLDGDIKKEELREALKLAEKGCKEIYEIQKKALKEKYKTLSVEK